MATIKHLILAISCFGLTMCKGQAQSSNLTVGEFEKGIAAKNIQVLDVRTMGEYQTGHLKNALLADWTNNAEFQQRVAALDKSKSVYLYCLSGGRSGAAQQYLAQNGFTAYNLSGGINAWKRESKPVEQAAAVKQMAVADYWQQIPKDKTVLVDFSAVWCPPCKKMTPIIDSLAKTHGQQFELVKIDGAAQTDIVKALQVEAFPTFIIYKAGQEVWRKQGLVEAAELLKAL